MTATDSITVHEGVTYADRDEGEMKLDLYLPSEEHPPLVVYIHGGGWIAETRDNVPDPERYAAEWGCAIASVSYRLQKIPDNSTANEMYDPSNPTPRGSFPDHFVDVKASIRWLRAHADDYGYNANAVAAWGSSAGGHLALLAGVVDDVDELGDAFAGELEKSVARNESGAVQAVVSWYGVADFALAATETEDIVPLLMGGSQSEYPDRYEQASPVAHVSPESPPTLLMHGREDEIVDVEQSRRFFDALDDVAVNAVRYELHALNHVWADSLEEIDSERTAMDLLIMDPQPTQSIYEVTHLRESDTAGPLIRDVPPAGPESIGRFLKHTLKQK